MSASQSTATASAPIVRDTAVPSVSLPTVLTAPNVQPITPAAPLNVVINKIAPTLNVKRELIFVLCEFLCTVVVEKPTVTNGATHVFGTPITNGMMPDHQHIVRQMPDNTPSVVNDTNGWLFID